MTKLTKAELASVVKWLQNKIVAATEDNDVGSLRLYSALLRQAHKEALEAQE